MHVCEHVWRAHNSFVVVFVVVVVVVGAPIVLRAYDPPLLRLSLSLLLSFSVSPSRSVCLVREARSTIPSTPVVAIYLRPL